MTLEIRGAGSELFLSIDREGAITGYNGHVDLGTGIATALAQIVAEELDVALPRVHVVLGHTGIVPNQGPTIASETIQVAAVPLRQAAAQARAWLVGAAAELWGVEPAGLVVEDGLVRSQPLDNRRVSYAELLEGRQVRLQLDRAAPVKAPGAYRIVGTRVPRVDIPAKATGTFVYVHDVRIPGMLHGRVVRPPYAGIDVGPFVGKSLISVDETSVAHLPGVVGVVRIGDFIGVVTEREEQAERAAAELVVTWAQPPSGPDLGAPEQALRANPSTPRVLLDRGDVDGALVDAAKRLTRTYVWPYQMHASIGPSCAVADVRAEAVTVWSGTQNPLQLRADLARLLERPEAEIRIVRHEAAGCYGRNCADDVSADAVLLSRAVARPVRVQLTRAQEHLWEPKGAAQVMDVDGGLAPDGTPSAYRFDTRYPSNGAPTLALLLTGMLPGEPAVFEMGDRTAIPPYAYPHARITVHDMAPIVRASWLRGVSALPNSFAHESFIDELATAAGEDPVAYRLARLDDPRATDLVRAVAERAGWAPHTGPLSHGREGDKLLGRGFAYAVYVHGRFPGTAAAWSAWVADVAVDRRTGAVEVRRVVVGQDTGQMINPAGVEHQVHGNVIQSTSRVIKEQVSFDAGGVASREWGGYPILTFPEVPVINVVLMERPTEPPLGAGESASVPSAAAIANAIFDATGVRFREPPFTPERVKALLNPEPPQPAAPRKKSRGWIGAALGACAALVGLGTVALPWRPALPAIPRPDPGVFSAATIERGRIAAALGDCAVCHVGPDGRLLGGGRPLETPFGIVYATNISPDPVAGIGGWSYPAFERAMREGISRDGHHLYPAHPYPSFTRAGDADLQALYAYLMAQPAAEHRPPKTALPFPFGLRGLMAGWNALYLRTAPQELNPSRSALWSRGSELVNGLAHCGACHSPRNLLGAELRGKRHLTGGVVDGWEAPALTAASTAPLPWTEEALFDYLRTGHSRHHGVAAGPMREVVASLADAPDEDLRAMAAYLASFQAEAPTAPALDAATLTLDEAARQRAAVLSGPGARLYDGACAACHETDGTLLHGLRPNLALNTSLHSPTPTNLVRVIREGIAATDPDRGAMPGFCGSLTDAQMRDLLTYLRARFAPDKPMWNDLASVPGRAGEGVAAQP